MSFTVQPTIAFVCIVGARMIWILRFVRLGRARLIRWPHFTSILMICNKEEGYIEDECVVCFERPPEGTFEPCQHKCVCRTCQPKLKLCPLCRCEPYKYRTARKKFVEDHGLHVSFDQQYITIKMYGPVEVHDIDKLRTLIVDCLSLNYIPASSAMFAGKEMIFNADGTISYKEHMRSYRYKVGNHLTVSCEQLEKYIRDWYYQAFLGTL